MGEPTTGSSDTCISCHQKSVRIETLPATGAKSRLVVDEGVTT
jgi:hypothetical protein